MRRFLPSLSTFRRFRVLTRRPRRVVYTCLFGDYERFNDFQHDVNVDIDHICFTDDPTIVAKHWKIIVVPRSRLDGSRATREIKAQPHRFLTGYDESLYIDNSVRLKVPAQQIFETYLAESSSPYVCFRHYERDCAYDEAEEVKRRRLDDPATIDAQMARYRRLGFPRKYGLAKNAFILRRHHEAPLPNIMEAWFQEIVRGSKRDQLSLNPIMWSHGFTPNYLPLKFSDFQLLEWPFADNVRIPADFVDADYVRLHPEAVANPRWHYLNVWAPQNMEKATGRAPAQV